MKTQLKKLLFLLIGMLMFGTTEAQDLVVNLTNGNTETHLVSNISSIKFNSNNIVLKDNNGTVYTWAIDDIDNYTFDGVTDLSDELALVRETATTFPNPSSENVNIVFNSNIAQRITIVITDAKGRLVYKIFEGKHENEKTYIWIPQSQGNAEIGNYFCRITTENKVITQPIIIQ